MISKRTRLLTGSVVKLNFTCVISAVCFGQNLAQIAPLRVTSLDSILAASSLKQSAGKLVDVSQANGQWAGLVHQTSVSSILIAGNSQLDHAYIVDGVFDRIVLDTNRHILLRYRPQKGDKATHAASFSEDSKQIGSFIITVPGAEPFANESGFQWRTRSGSAEIGVSHLHSTDPILDQNFSIPQPVTTGAQNVGSYFTFGALSETITIVDEARETTPTSLPVQLDTAYQAVGLRPGLRDVAAGRTSKLSRRFD